MTVPFLDLRAQQAEIADEVRAGFDEVLASTGFIGGPRVAEFEAAYAAYLGVGHCVGVGNGTDALELALNAVGVTAGAEVIVPANSFIATAEAVSRLGAVPVLVDVDPVYLLMDPEKAVRAITRRTQAIVPVHLYGQAAYVEELTDIAGLPVVEDAAQAQGARRLGRAAGSLGAAAATSFYPGKNLGAAGDAGAVTTDDPLVAALVRRLHAHGSTQKYVHEMIGCNSRLDALQAVYLSAKLARLEAWNQRRRDAADRYAELLGDIPGLRLPWVAPGNEHVWHLYVVRVRRREEVRTALAAAGIETGVHYPVPIHLTPAYAQLGYSAGTFPVTETASEEVLSLPMGPHLTAEQQEQVADALRAVLRR